MSETKSSGANEAFNRLPVTGARNSVRQAIAVQGMPDWMFDE